MHANRVCEAAGPRVGPALPFNRQTTLNGPNPSAPITIIADVGCQGTGNSAAFSPVVY